MYCLHTLTALTISLIVVNLSLTPETCTGSVLEAGPYKMLIKRFEKCPNEGTKQMVMDLHLRKADRDTVYIYGNITFKFPLNRKIQIKLSSSVWGNGGWRPNDFTLNAGKDSCAKVYEVMGSFWKRLWALANHTMTDPCNIPSGNYVLDDLDGNSITMPLLPIMFYGLYRNDLMIFSSDDKLLGCVRSVFSFAKKE